MATIVASACAITMWVHGPAAAQTRTATTVAGCIQLEAAFRNAHGLALAIGSQPDADLVVVDGGGAAYVLNGTRERDLRSRVGRRAEVTGAIEASSRDAAPAVVPGVTPDGSAAHETADAATAVRVGRPVPAAPEPPRLNVQSFRRIDGDCPRLPVPPARPVSGEGDRRGVSTPVTEPPVVKDGARLPPPEPVPAHPSAPK